MNPDRPPSSSSPRPSRTAQALIGYAVFGLAWVLLSDQALLAIAPDAVALSTLSQWKGTAFVLLSGLMLYWLLRPTPELRAAEKHAGLASPGRLLLIFAVLSAVIVFAGLSLLARLSQAPADADLRTQMLRTSSWIAAVQVLALAVCGSLLVLMWQRRELRMAEGARQQQHERLHALQLLDGIANGSTDAIYALDAEMRFLFVNDQVCRVLGATRDTLIGQDATSFFPAMQAERMRRAVHGILRTQRVLRHEGMVSTPSGRRAYLDTLGPLHAPEGHQAIGVFGISRDVTERKRGEARQRQWAQAFANTRDGVLITDAHHRILTVNRAFTHITGYSEAEAAGHTPTLLRSGRDGPAFYADMRRHLNEEGHWQGEIWNRRKNGEVFPEWLTIDAVRDAQGEITHYVGVFTDMTVAKHREAQIERLAHYDPLTELPNRRLIQARLEQALAHAQRHGTRVAVLSIDIDRFKALNESFGHPAGDELIAVLGARLKSRLRSDDSLGRLGGDEFLVVLDTLNDPTEAGTVARDLLDAIAQPVKLASGRLTRVTGSIGISVHPDDGSATAVEMLRDADAALYRAKAEGGHRFSFFTRDLHAHAVEQFELEFALSHAVERQELELHFQPKVRASDGTLVGGEALLRWRRDGQMVSPAQFIPVAERSGLILEIGGWVIDRACEQLRAWMDAGLQPVPIAVNVAARQFAAGDLDDVIARALERHRVPAQWLEVELTESMLMDHGAAQTELLQRLRKMGLRLSLDDFGTGYSNLGYLQRFPIDALKIDQSFVRDIGPHQDGGAVIVDAVIALAHRLHLRVVAEGVETDAQRDYLRAQGCDVLQGYRFGRPEPAHVFVARLSAAAKPANDARASA